MYPLTELRDELILKNIFGRRSFAISQAKDVISPEQKYKIKYYLKNLDEQHRLLKSLLIATKSGNLLIFSNLTNTDSEKSRLGFMSASLTGLIGNLAKCYAQREILSFTIETAAGIVSSSLIKFPSEDALLLCVFSPDVALGLAIRDFDFHKKSLSHILLTDQ